MNNAETLPHADHPAAQGKRRAAVLAPLQYRDEEWHLLLIRRSQRDGDRHSGQVAFPGGRVESSDASLTAAALREAEEEIGLPPAHVEVLGLLPDYTTITDYLVTPVAGIVTRPFRPVLQSTEVSRLFSIPLQWLRNPDNQRRGAGLPDRPDMVYFNEWQGETLWGATAAMTLHLLRAIDQEQLQLPN